jgi:hypothetical protein
VRRGTLVLGLALLALAGGCGGSDQPDVDAAAEFDRFPIYWLTEEFEGHELVRLDGYADGGVYALDYRTCDPPAFDGGCASPLQLQIFPLCYQLAEVTRNPIWRRRTVRGAPVGHIDGAPVLFTRTMQVKVYRGQGSDRDMPMRALEILHSLNDAEPFIPALGSIPPPPDGVLEGDVPCTD